MQTPPLSFVLSLVLIISVAVAAWLGSSFWEPAEVSDLFVVGRASPPPGLQIPLVCPNPWHLGTFLGLFGTFPLGILHFPVLSQV